MAKSAAAAAAGQQGPANRCRSVNRRPFLLHFLQAAAPDATARGHLTLWLRAVGDERAGQGAVAFSVGGRALQEWEASSVAPRPAAARAGGDLPRFEWQRSGTGGKAATVRGLFRQPRACSGVTPRPTCARYVRKCVVRSRAERRTEPPASEWLLAGWQAVCAAAAALLPPERARHHPAAAPHGE